ncbi:MAG TPA: hypothetical protein VGN20_15645 [Mucilaginibacter sp.]|jgi:hypothetical protein
MKKYCLIIFSFCLLLSSCATVSYTGNVMHTPTTSVVVYYSAYDVKRDYKVIGHMHYSSIIDQDAVKQKFVKYAKSVGADAIVIAGFKDRNRGNHQSVTLNADALKYTN